MRYTPVRCTPCEMHAYGMHAYGMHAHETPAYVHAHEMHAYETPAYEMHYLRLLVVLAWSHFSFWRKVTLGPYYPR